MKISACRSCGDPVVWAEFASGKKSPFDIEPSAAGDWALNEAYDPPKATKLHRAAGSTEEGYTSHFATCPDADSHRRGR